MSKQSSTRIFLVLLATAALLLSGLGFRERSASNAPGPGESGATDCVSRDCESLNREIPACAAQPSAPAAQAPVWESLPNQLFSAI